MIPKTRDDRRKKLWSLPCLRQKSLVSELCEIQKYAQTAEKAHEWAKELLCIRYENSDSGHQFRETYKHALQRDFVAISWTRQPSRWESPVSGKYSVLPPHENLNSGTPVRVRALGIRDCVLDRVVKYLRACELDTCWIDEVCIDQGDMVTKSKAINSMDLVYKRARRSLGLLSSPIRSNNAARLLESLLDGRIAFEDDRGRFRFKQRVRKKTIVTLLHTLEALTGDDWWKRAWIYQEEYLSGPRMDLLIPVGPGFESRNYYGRIPGEFCVQAIKLREQATIFLQACSTHNWSDTNARRMLEVIGKYSITLKSFAGSIKTMTARIFVDVAQRDVDKTWDTLAITANACAYDIRLDVDALRRQGHSLSLSLLALYLLNGEIFLRNRINNYSRHDSLNHTISGLLEILQPKFDGLPISAKALTFLKHCRFPLVRFNDRGVETKGYIWSLPRRANIKTADFRLPRLPANRRTYLKENPWDSLELQMLIEKLEQRNENLLAAKLQSYVDRRKAKVESAALLHLDLMACKLFQAINKGRQLRCGYLPGKLGAGIFIPHRCELVHSMHVLTTWQPPRQSKNRVGNFASLKIGLRPDGTAVPERWANGMTFFSCEDISEVTIGWPQSWKLWPQKTRKRS